MTTEQIEALRRLEDAAAAVRQARQAVKDAEKHFRAMQTDFATASERAAKGQNAATPAKL